MRISGSVLGLTTCGLRLRVFEFGFGACGGWAHLLGLGSGY